MALTRPKVWDIDTNITAFNDPITVLHQGATSANIDVGFLFNRANGLVSNVALYWNESAQSIVTAFTANTGVSDGNVTVSSYANLTIGNLLSINGNIYLNGVQGSPGQFITSTTSGTAWTSSAFSGGYVISQTTFGSNIVGNSGTASTSTSTGALVILGGAGISGNVYAGNVYTAGGVYWSGNGAAYSSGSGTTFTGGYVPNQSTFGSNLVANSATTSTSTSTGALVVVGGAGISGNVTAGGQVQATLGLYSTGAFNGGYSDGTVVDYTSGTGRISVGSGDNLKFYQGGPASTETMIIAATSGNVVIAATTTSTGTTTGALVVQGGVGTAGNVYSGGNHTVTNGFYDTGAFNGPTTLSGVVADYSSSIGRFSVGASAGFKFYNGGLATTELLVLASSGNVVIPVTTTSTSNVTGALVVAGGAGISGNIYTTGNVYTNNRVGFTFLGNSTSAAYQVYNATTSSIDTIFG